MISKGHHYSFLLYPFKSNLAENIYIFEKCILSYVLLSIADIRQASTSSKNVFFYLLMSMKLVATYIYTDCEQIKRNIDYFLDIYATSEY